MINEQILVSGIQYLETPPPRLVMLVGNAPQERLWIVSTLERHSHIPKTARPVVVRVYPHELFVLAFAYLLQDYLATLERAIYRLRGLWHRILAPLRNLKKEP